MWTRRTMLAAFLAIALHQPGAEAKDVEGKGETSMSAFVSVYSGLFHNQEKHAADPNTPFASKYHIPIHNDFLCPSSASGTVEEMVASAKKRCFYVHEKTNRAGAMQYRLRVAVISIKEGVSAGDDVFTAVHYQFADQASLEALTEEECARRASAMDASQLSVVEGGAVDFRKRPEENVYDVVTAYDTCPDAEKAKTGADAKPAAPGGGVKTQVTGILRTQGWDVVVVGTHTASGREVFKTHLVMERVGLRNVPTVE